MKRGVLCVVYQSIFNEHFHFLIKSNLNALAVPFQWLLYDSS